jgi:ankyrin repeat protein
MPAVRRLQEGSLLQLISTNRILAFFLIQMSLAFLTGCHEHSESDDPLVAAAYRGEVSTVKAMLDTGYNINERNPDGRTALMDSSSQGHEHVVQLLLENGADVNATDRSGRTALMDAAWNGHTVIMLALLARGADANAKDNDGRTVLMYAAYRSSDATRILLAAGADLGTKANDGMTALGWAKEGRNFDAEELLRAAGGR